jgi:hypothetical protein
LRVRARLPWPRSHGQPLRFGQGNRRISEHGRRDKPPVASVLASCLPKSEPKEDDRSTSVLGHDIAAVRSSRSPAGLFLLPGSTRIVAYT